MECTTNTHLAEAADKVNDDQSNPQLARQVMNFDRDEMKLEGLSAHARHCYRAPIACANVVWPMREMFMELASVGGRHESTHSSSSRVSSESSTTKTWSQLNANLPTISPTQTNPSDASPLLSTIPPSAPSLPMLSFAAPNVQQHFRHAIPSTFADSTISQHTQPSFDRGSVQSHDSLAPAGRGINPPPQYHQLYRSISGGAGSDVASSPALSALASLAASVPTAEVGSGTSVLGVESCLKHMLLGFMLLGSTIHSKLAQTALAPKPSLQLALSPFKY
ncbi:hypothetical protein LTR74_008796 [Friedmanniomyces endolithicus]|nr:hypothetical protein LTR74_008796 [Friedmanniomyces endolithicus]